MMLIIEKQWIKTDSHRLEAAGMRKAGVVLWEFSTSVVNKSLESAQPLVPTTGKLRPAPCSVVVPKMW